MGVVLFQLMPAKDQESVPACIVTFDLTSVDFIDFVGRSKGVGGIVRGKCKACFLLVELIIRISLIYFFHG